MHNAALWDEVKDRLKESALGFIRRSTTALSSLRVRSRSNHRCLLLDEPASALDPISTLKIEELIHQLKADYTIVIVTHNMQQAARVSDHTAFLYLGELVEFDKTETMFTNPIGTTHGRLHHRQVRLA